VEEVAAVVGEAAAMGGGPRRVTAASVAVRIAFAVARAARIRLGGLVVGSRVDVLQGLQSATWARRGDRVCGRRLCRCRLGLGLLLGRLFGQGHVDGLDVVFLGSFGHGGSG
jgi:hypothetical protein